MKDEAFLFIAVFYLAHEGDKTSERNRTLGRTLHVTSCDQSSKRNFNKKPHQLESLIGAKREVNLLFDLSVQHVLVSTGHRRPHQ